MIITLLLTSIQSLINRYLLLSPEVEKRLLQLEDKIIYLEIQGLNIRLYFTAKLQGIYFFQHTEKPFDASIQGPPLALLRLLQEDNSVLHNKEVIIKGDVRLIVQWQRLFHQTDVDWEEQLSHIIGDFAAHQVFVGKKELEKYTEKQTQDLLETSKIYLQDEIRLLPSALETEKFLNDIDILRSDIDRLEARIDLLMRKS